MKIPFIIIGLLLSSTALAHPNGTYVIDQQSSVTVAFSFVGRCPPVQGALQGGLRQLTFSDAAIAEPYDFVSGNYVEIYEDGNEVYVNTDDQCVPTETDIAIPATRNTFGGFSLQRTQE